MTQFEAVMNQEPQLRYNYFIKKVCETKEVWVLYKDSCAQIIDPQGNTLFPFFPEKEFADVLAEGTEFKAESLNLVEFVNEWLLQMKKDNVKPAIFPNGQNMRVVSVDLLVTDLQKEIEKLK